MSTSPHHVPGAPVPADRPAPEVVLHEERLRVQTREVPVERVVLRRRVVTEVRQVEVTVRREELEVHRLPVEGTRSARPESPRTTTIVLSEEVPVVQLQTRPYERVTVTVETVAGQQQVSAEVSREQVEVDVQDGRAARE